MDFKKEVTKCIKKENLSEELIEIPSNPSMGDFAIPCFSLAKQYKKPPKIIAEELAKRIKPNKHLKEVKATGPYLNFFLEPQYVCTAVINIIKKERGVYGKGKGKDKVVIEFPSPNTNKPLHLGHVRNIIFGQSISNILAFQGADVIQTNLNNDRGIHICKSMVAYEKFGKGSTPAKEGMKPDHFVGKYYVKFAQAAKKDPSLEEEAKESLRKWEDGDKKTRALWKKMNTWAFKGWAQTFKIFNLKFNKEYYESNLYDKGRDIILKAYKKGIVQRKKDGAYFLDLGQEGLGEKILLRSDGTSIYITQDIYLAYLKNKEFRPNKSLVITAIEQEYHFKVLLSILKKLGFSWAENVSHLWYGMVNLEYGRMKSREGTVVDADDIIANLIALAKDELRKRYDTLSTKELERRAETIALAALRYFFLRVDKVKDVTFKPKESISFEGDTGPYLLYTYARAKSILRKAKKKSNTKGTPTEEGLYLLKELGRFPAVTKRAAETDAPHVVCQYLSGIARMFNEWYHAYKVIGSENESFRLAIVESTAQVLKNGLSLLDISVLEEM